MGLGFFTNTCSLKFDGRFEFTQIMWIADVYPSAQKPLCMIGSRDLIKEVESLYCEAAEGYAFLRYDIANKIKAYAKMPPNHSMSLVRGIYIYTPN